MTQFWKSWKRGTLARTFCTLPQNSVKSLLYPWSNADMRLDALSTRIQDIAAAADAAKWPRSKTFGAIWAAAHEAAGLQTPELAPAPTKGVPFLSEPGYCCAEPTTHQLVSLGVGPVEKQQPATLTADSFV